MTEKQHAFRSVGEFRSYLELEGVPVDAYGKDTAKTLEHLFKEVISGSCVLTKENGEIVRKVRSADIIVFYKSKDGLLMLKEDKQVFTDGRVRKRDLPCSISEKLEAGEDPLAAVVRAFDEELGITDEISVVPINVECIQMESPSYSGIKTSYELHYFQAHLPVSVYNPDGYTETQQDKTTFFVWEQVR